MYVPRDEVLAFAEREGAISFDAEGAKYTHRDGLCSFEVMVDEYKLGGDPALALLAKVVLAPTCPRTPTRRRSRGVSRRLPAGSWTWA